MKKDISHFPIHISAGSISTWQNNEIRVFQASGNAEIEQGDIRIVADNIIIWFKEVKTGQIVEGNLEIYCSGNVTLFQEEDIQDSEETYLVLVTTAGVSVSPTQTNAQVKSVEDVQVTSFEDEQRSELYAQAEKFKAEERGEPYKDGTSTATADVGEMVDILADDIDTWLENDVRVIVAIGNVRIKKSGETLNADNVILYFEQEESDKGKSPKQVYKEVYAEGNVTLTRGSDLIIAEKIFQNIKDDKGLFVNSTIESVLEPPAVKIKLPAFISGDEIKNTKGNYEIKNGNFSLCGYGHPHYKFKYSKLRIIKTEGNSILTAKNNVFKIGKVPLMYVPYLNFNLKTSPKRLEKWDTGTTTRFGRFVTTDWDLYGFGFGKDLAKWSDVTVSLDYMALKGPRAGTNIKYRKENFSGYLNTYYMTDKDETGINGVTVENGNRGHFLWRNRLMLSKILAGKSGTNDNESDIIKYDDWIADIEISDVSDRTYFREYLQSDFKQGKDRSTLFYLRKISGNRGVTFLAEHQLRTYDTLIDSARLSRKNESLPELKYRIIGEPLWGGKLNITSETGLAYQNRMFDRISPLKAETNYLGRGELLTAERVFDKSSARFAPKKTVRFDTFNMINAPFHFMKQQFNPFIGIRLTGYSESINVDPVTGGNDGNGTPRGRVAIPIGFNTSAKLSRTYSVYNKFLNINRLRHVVEPELSLNFTPIVTQNPEDLNQFDGIDAIDTYKSIKLGLRNRLQTKRGKPGKEKTVDVVDFGSELILFPGNAGLNRKRDDYIGWYLKANLTDNVSISSVGNEINLKKGGIDIFNLGLRYTPLPQLSFSAGNRYINNISSTVHFSTSLSINDKWSASLSQQYAFRTARDDNSSRSLYSAANITRNFHDWIFIMSLAQIGTRTNDNIVSFNILPRGLGVATPTLRSLGVIVPPALKPQQN
ncbi:MAG: LPS assembly protein LptD [Candidatus Scalindua sp.]|nr:LPS assembly protein LptD [Candidatus Scalindua sp.]MCR4343695.1 LPS assembly protein LptD [Candidatus Scalindua sp.]